MATKFFMNGGVNSNWSTDGNWSTTASSGPANTTKAVNGDAAVFDSGSPSCIIDAASACTSIVCTGYTNTLTFNANLTVAGTVTFASTMAAPAGTSDLICNTTATLTSGGKTLTGGLQLAGTSQTYTLSGAWIVNGALTFNGTTAVTLNSSTLSVGGGITVTTTTVSGTTVITATAGTISGAGQLRNALTLAGGNITFSGTVSFRGGPLTYSSGTVVTTGSTLALGVNGTLSTSGVTWNNVSLSASTVATVNSALAISGTLQLPTGSTSFVGTSGFSASTLTNTAGAATLSLKSSNTYTITNSWFAPQTSSANRLTLVASTPGTKAILTLNSGADSSLDFVDPTDIDSSGGIPIFTYKGTITTSTNWVNGYLTLPAVSVVQSSKTFGYSDAISTGTLAGGPSIGRGRLIT